MYLRLKSKYSKRMYQMLCQWRNTGVMRISVKELKERFGLIDQKTGKEQYTEFGLFANKVLDVSKQEIAKHTNISFSYIPKKRGRKITDLEFRITCEPILKNLNFSTNTKLIHTPLANHSSVVSHSQGDANSKNYTYQQKKEYEKLPLEQAQAYLKLIEEPKKGGFGWLKNNKELAFTLVKNIPINNLWGQINKIEIDIKNGNLTYLIPEYFQELLALQIKQGHEIKTEKLKEGEFIFSVWKRMIVEFKIDRMAADNIVGQIKVNKIPYRVLQSVLDKVFKTLKNEEITNKEAYILGELNLVLSKN